MPEFAKISHVSYSTRDKDRSARFLREIMGFQDLEEVSGDGWSGIVMVHPQTGTVMEYQQHDRNDGEAFDPARTGLDHLGFMVRTRAELARWQDHFVRLGVTHTPVVDREYGSVLTFKDPDGIQFEMFYREGHP